jgi:hypothetical protein
MSTDRTSFKILIVSDFDGQNANVINDFLFCFNKHSRHDYYYIFDPRAINESTDFSTFDAILLFWSVYLPGSTFSTAARQKIKQAAGLKILFLQDEYRNVRMFNQLMSELGIQLMFTCVAEKDHPVFYPSELIPSLRATYTVLTGYVPSYLEAYPLELTLPRKIDIAYRSRSLPYYLGDLGREKLIVAKRFQEISLEHGFHGDISVREEDRIYGDGWIQFLQNSRFVLGSPSGASVIDFNGDIGRNCENHLLLNPTASYQDVKQRFFADLDGKFVIDTVSPRIFESAALGCVMVMHEGFYGGILESGKHYICVKKDYSNLKEVISQMRDDTYCRQIADCAYQDLIASGNFSYQKFALWFDSVLDDQLMSNSRQKFSKFGFYASNYLKFGQTLLPREDGFISLPGRKILGYFRKIQTLERNVRLYFPFLGSLWRLLFSYFWNRLWKQVPPKSLIMDLSRLGLAYSLIANKKVITTEFGVKANYTPARHMLSLVSHALPVEDRVDSADLKNEFALDQWISSLQEGQALLERDHSPVRTYLEYRYGRKIYSLDMGTDGHYRFTALAKLAQEFPALLAEALHPILGIL